MAKDWKRLYSKVAKDTGEGEGGSSLKVRRPTIAQPQTIVRQTVPRSANGAQVKKSLEQGAKLGKIAPTTRATGRTKKKPY